MTPRLTLSKPRPAQWHRNQNRPPLNETSNYTAPPKPPIPATAQSKSKLKAFQFVPGLPDDQQEALNKENIEHKEDVSKDEKMEESAVPIAEVTSVNKSSSAPQATSAPTSAPQLPDAQTFPCTPGTRLPLEDLIGDFDENAKKPEPQDQSPEEYLGWNPNSSANSFTPNRKRKRARSSSPSGADSSSQRQEASTFFAGDVENAGATATEVDPSADLWQRYGAEKQTDTGAKLPDFSHLMFQVSPRALKTPAKSGGLRRWASTGNDWPNSKSKRRRVTSKTTNDLWQDDHAAEPAEKSKFVDMLTKVEESLASQKLAKEQSKPTVRVEGPSSSSPLPEVGAPDAFNGAAVVSPLQTKQTPAMPKAIGIQAQNEVSKATPGVTRTASAKNRPVSPKITYGPATDASISAPLCLQGTAALPAFKRPSFTRTPSEITRKKQTLQRSAPAAPVVVTGDLEEFGDDLDLTAEDLEELMSQPPPLDQRPLHQIPAHPDPAPQQAFNGVLREASAQDIVAPGCAAQPIQLDDEDDEFGMDDIDEASFAAVEIKATQASRASHPNSYVSNVTGR